MSEAFLAAASQSHVEASEAILADVRASATLGPILQQIEALFMAGVHNLPATLAAIQVTFGGKLPAWVVMAINFIVAIMPVPAPAPLPSPTTV